MTEYDMVCVEDLGMKPLLETSRNAKNKQRSQFLDRLEDKGDLHGTSCASNRQELPQSATSGASRRNNPPIADGDEVDTIHARTTTSKNSCQLMGCSSNHFSAT